MAEVLLNELRRANTELRAANQSRQELVSMLAHDIRGLLSAVSSAVEMTQADLEDLPRRDAHRFLTIAERNTGELVNLATTLLDSDRLADADDCKAAYEAGTVVLIESERG